MIQHVDQFCAVALSSVVGSVLPRVLYGCRSLCSFCVGTKGREVFRGLFNILSKSVILELLDNFFTLL